MKGNLLQGSENWIQKKFPTFNPYLRRQPHLLTTLHFKCHPGSLTHVIYPFRSNHQKRKITEIQSGPTVRANFGTVHMPPNKSQFQTFLILPCLSLKSPSITKNVNFRLCYFLVCPNLSPKLSSKFFSFAPHVLNNPTKIKSHLS